MAIKKLGAKAPATKPAAAPAKPAGKDKETAAPAAGNGKGKATAAPAEAPKTSGKGGKKAYEPVEYRKEALVAHLMEAYSLSNAEANRQVDHVIDALVYFAGKLKGGEVNGKYKGDKLQLTGILTIEKVKRAARKGYDPQKKVEVAMPAKEVIKLRMGKKFKSITQ